MFPKLPLKKRLNRAISPVLRDLVRRQAAVERLEDRTLMSVTNISVDAINPTEGTPFGAQASPAQIATFNVNNFIGVDESSEYSAEINWGDGTESAGLGPVTVTFLADLGNGNAEYGVNSHHTYTEATPVGNPLSLTVEIFDNTGPGNTQAASGPVTVNDAMLSQSALPAITATAGTSLTNADVADFTDANPYAQASDLSASVTFDSPGQTVPGVIVEDASGVFHVLASHTYNDTAGGTSSPIEVTVTHGMSSLTMQNSAAVSPSPLTGSAGYVITGVEGNSTGSVSLGTFVDGDQAATAANYTTGGGSVVVNWGDGSAPQTLTASNLTAIGTGAGTTWIISAAHTYTEEGTYACTVTVTNEDGAATIVAGSAIIADAPLSAGAPTLLTANNGIALPGTTVVATFTDTNTFATTGDSTSQVDWGDGSPDSTGIIVATATPGVFDVEAGHTYAKPGDFTTLVTVHDDGGAQVVVAGSSTITTPPPPVNIVASPVLTPVDTILPGANTGTIVVATFTDAAPEPLGDYTATITWGNGHTSSGSISLSGSTFIVKGSNTYTDAGEYSPKVTIKKDALTPRSVTDTNRVDVLVTAHIASDGGVTFSGLEGRTVSPTVANFTSVNTSNPASDYSATINWGDGTASTVGTVVSTGGGHFHIVGTHVYDKVAAYTVTMTLKDTFGDTVTIKSTAKITDAPLELPAGKSLTVLHGSTFTNLVLGSFRDDDAVNTNPAEYAGTINWGDGGGTSAAKFVFTGKTANLGSYWNVEGTHKYATAKTYAVTIDIHDVNSQGNVILITTTIKAT